MSENLLLSPRQSSQNLLAMRHLLPLFMLFALLAAGQQTVRMRGISLADMPVSDSVAADGGTVWDFTAVQQRGRTEGQYIPAGDSSVMELMEDMRWDFSTSGIGERCLACVEGRNWRVAVDSLPIDGRSERCDTMLLSVDLSHPFLLTGHTRQHIVYDQTIIRQPGDTVSGGAMMRIRFDGIRQSLLQDSLSSPLSVERRYWFAPKGRYPIAMATSVDGLAMSTYLFDDCDTACNSPSAASSPFREMSVQNVAARQQMPRQREDAATARFGAADAPQISIEGQTVTVAAVDDLHEVILCDVAGRVFAASTMTDGIVRFADLPAGDYILSVSNGGEERQSFKFYLPSMR